MSTPGEPTADPTRFPDNEADSESPEVDVADEADQPEDVDATAGAVPPYNPFAPGEPFTTGESPREDPQSQASL